MICFDMKETSNRNGKRIKNKKAIFTKIKDKLFLSEMKIERIHLSNNNNFQCSHLIQSDPDADHSV